MASFSQQPINNSICRNAKETAMPAYNQALKNIVLESRNSVAEIDSRHWPHDFVQAVSMVKDADARYEEIIRQWLASSRENEHLEELLSVISRQASMEALQDHPHTHMWFLAEQPKSIDINQEARELAAIKKDSWAADSRTRLRLDNKLVDIDNLNAELAEIGKPQVNNENRGYYSDKTSLKGCARFVFDPAYRTAMNAIEDCNRQHFDVFKGLAERERMKEAESRWEKIRKKFPYPRVDQFMQYSRGYVCPENFEELPKVKDLVRWVLDTDDVFNAVKAELGETFPSALAEAREDMKIKSQICNNAQSDIAQKLGEKNMQEFLSLAASRARMQGERAEQKNAWSQPSYINERAKPGRREDDKPFSISGDRLADQFLFWTPHS
jgi:hypothetical protein